MYIMADYKLPTGIAVKFWRVGNIKIDSLNKKLWVEVLGYMDISHYMKNRFNGTLERFIEERSFEWETCLQTIGSASELEKLAFSLGLKKLAPYNPIIYTDIGVIVDPKSFEGFEKYFS
jgi:hypothetical protein